MKFNGTVRKEVRESSSISEEKLPPEDTRKNQELGQYRSPLPHQTEALFYAHDLQRIALFMEMRLGKSLVAIRWAKKRIENLKTIQFTRTLIVAPISVLPEWERELKAEGVSGEDIHYLVGSKKDRLERSNPSELSYGWFLVNYEGLRAVPELFSHDWFTVILDESTKVRNPKAQITKLCIKNFENVPNRAILSGLPAPESPMDYFTQFQFLHGGFLGMNNYWAFRFRYFSQLGYDWFPKNGTTEAIKKTVHSLAFVLTRKQAKIGPKKVYETRYVYMNPKQKKAYKKLEKEFAIDIKGEEIQTKWNPVKLSWMQQISGGFLPQVVDPQSKDVVYPVELISEEKIKELYSLLTGELKNEKVIVWFRFNSELHAVRKYLNRKGIDCAWIYGDVCLDQRRRATDQFRNESHVRVMLAQIKCGKFGVDWSVASTAIYYSNSYEMEDRAQSEDRIVHPKKSEPTLFIDLVTKDTVDEDVLQTLKDKYVTSRMFMIKLLENLKRRTT